MKHRLLGKIAIAAAIVFLIGVGGSAIYGFKSDYLNWEGTTTKTKTLSNESVQHKTKSVDLGKAKSVDADVKLSVGELNLYGGAKPLMDGDFSYNKELEPLVEYHVNEDKGNLRIKQNGPSYKKVKIRGHNANKWHIKFNNDIPLELNIETGESKSSLHLGDLNLQHLHAKMGVGETKIDLRGDWKNSLDADIQLGVGETTILLPKTTGVKVNVDKGLGTVSTSGLTKSGDSYHNGAYEKSDSKIDIQLEMGVGEVVLKAEK